MCVHLCVNYVIAVRSLVRLLLTFRLPHTFSIKGCTESYQTAKQENAKKKNKEEKGEKKERGREGGEGFHSCC